MAWEVEYTDQFGDWFAALSEAEQEFLATAVVILQQRGPGLGRPLVDTIKASRHPNMKELRPLGGNIRVLSAFDPRRMAILLIGATERTGGERGIAKQFRWLTNCTMSIWRF